MDLQAREQRCRPAGGARGDGRVEVARRHEMQLFEAGVHHAARDGADVQIVLGFDEYDMEALEQRFADAKAQWRQALDGADEDVWNQMKHRAEGVWKRLQDEIQKTIAEV